ncbi:hypothetical protein LAZ40_04435 [Cereibacter sphaeroides]|nr:hypothetical protein [Cereibacter sphaeroides]
MKSLQPEDRRDMAFLDSIHIPLTEAEKVRVRAATFPDRTSVASPALAIACMDSSRAHQTERFEFCSACAIVDALHSSAVSAEEKQRVREIAHMMLAAEGGEVDLEAIASGADGSRLADPRRWLALVCAGEPIARIEDWHVSATEAERLVNREALLTEAPGFASAKGTWFEMTTADAGRAASDLGQTGVRVWIDTMLKRRADQPDLVPPRFFILLDDATDPTRGHVTLGAWPADVPEDRRLPMPMAQHGHVTGYCNAPAWTNFEADITRLKETVGLDLQPNYMGQRLKTVNDDSPEP